MAFLGIFLGAILTIILIWKYSTRNFNYWKIRGVPYLKPVPFIGNFLDVFLLRSSIGFSLAKFYNEFLNEPYFGMYVLNKPHLVIKSPDLIKTILVKDFNNFYDRTSLCDPKCDPLTSNMLFVAKNPDWKALRTKMTPVFTSGKIKNMLELINSVAEEMKAYINKNIHEPSLEAKELCAKYSTDVIASCAFGINAHSFECENAQFRVIGRKMFEFHWKTSFRQTAYFLVPRLVTLLRMPFLDPSVSSFMREVFWKTIEERGQAKHKRNDLIDTIIKMKEQNKSDDILKFEGDRVVAQAGQFYAAGFETVSATMSFTLYELCLHTNIQTKLRTEIKSILAKHKKFDYDAIQDMKYLHMVICEILRKYPVLPFLDRMCMEDYKLPGTNLLIEKGTPVYIPMFGLHYDPVYFPNPETFDPDRFSDENKNKLGSFTYIPFGEGPRNCIGERFGLLATKLGLAQILLEFEVDKSLATPVPIQFETKTFFLASNVGLPIKFRKPISVAG